MLTAIATMVLLAYILHQYIAIETLAVPDGWKPSDESLRKWYINPVYNLGPGEIIGAVVPAALVGVGQWTLVSGRLNLPVNCCLAFSL